MTASLSAERLYELRAALVQAIQAHPSPEQREHSFAALRELLVEVERLQEIEDTAGALAACEYCESALNARLDETNRHLGALRHALNRDQTE